MLVETPPNKSSCTSSGTYLPYSTAATKGTNWTTNWGSPRAGDGNVGAPSTGERNPCASVQVTSQHPRVFLVDVLPADGQVHGDVIARGFGHLAQLPRRLRDQDLVVGQLLDHFHR